MENLGNPAKRLYEIIIEAEKVYRVAKSKRASTISWHLWAEVFNIEETESRESQLNIINRVNQCSILVDEVEFFLLENKEIDHNKYLRPFPKLKSLFTIPFKLIDSFDNYFKLGGADITILEFCIDAVAKVYREKTVDEDELKDLLNEIRDLYEEIVGLKIDNNLKRILLDILKIMENAIHEYRIRGIERLHEAVEQFIGIYIVNKEVIENSESKEVGKVKKLISKFGSIYSFAADSVQLLGASEVIKNTGEFITKLLGSGQ